MECMRDHFKRDQILDGRFKAIAPLNHGSFGMVFLAQDLLTRQEVAIKCLAKPAIANLTNVAVPLDEGAEELACHAILKHHPHLVNLVHHFETTAHTYLVLEYCSQGDLYEAIRHDRGPRETEHVRDFMLQLLSAVEHMHQNGLFHRDIKPENIFLTHEGSVKLGDFGLATRSLWSDEACVGSDRYMAPEQYDPAGEGYLPAKADLWSVGICLLNVLFSRNPFVSPSESDVLFADYRKDRQSLFDVFPSMSQDTFEILSIALAIDPAKRDLEALRGAILRAVAFTTDDDSLDEFCTEERDTVRASANRPPLRTPSIQSPQMDGEAFPWAKALHSSPAPRQLSAIPDDFYDEDLFATSEKGLGLAESWFSRNLDTSSLNSMLESHFSASFKSMAIPARTARNPPRAGPIVIPNSVPTPASRAIPSMSQVFGKKDTVAKSWSDMWEEDEEDFGREEAVPKVPEQSTRSRSNEGPKKPSPVSNVLREKKSCSALNARPPRAIKPVMPLKPSHSPNENENDPYGWRVRSPKRSPKSVSADQWAALGDRRRNGRNVQPSAETTATPFARKRSMTAVSRKRSNSTAQDHYHWNRRNSRSKAHPAHYDNDWRQHKTVDSSPDDAEWVGGWHNFHL